MEIKYTETFRNDMERLFSNKFVYKLERLWGKIIDIPNEIKYFIQRGKRGYSDSDVWDLNSYLESWLPEALDDLAKQKNGYPGYGKAKTLKKWQGILKRIANGIRSVRIAEEKYNLKEEIKAHKKQKKALLLMVEWWGHLWD